MALHVLVSLASSFSTFIPLRDEEPRLCGARLWESWRRIWEELGIYGRLLCAPPPGRLSLTLMRISSTFKLLLWCLYSRFESLKLVRLLSPTRFRRYGGGAVFVGWRDGGRERNACPLMSSCDGTVTLQHGMMASVIGTPGASFPFLSLLYSALALGWQDSGGGKGDERALFIHGCRLYIPCISIRKL